MKKGGLREGQNWIFSLEGCAPGILFDFTPSSYFLVSNVVRNCKGAPLVPSGPLISVLEGSDSRRENKSMFSFIDKHTGPERGLKESLPEKYLFEIFNNVNIHLYLFYDKGIKGTILISQYLLFNPRWKEDFKYL